MTLTDRHGHTLTADRMIGAYGVGTVEHCDETGEAFVVYRQGLLAEQAEHFIAAGGRVFPRVSDSRKGWAVLPTGEAYPVVCGDLIPVMTEDGPSDGRCGLDADADGQCEGHAAEYRAYMADSAYA